MKLSSTSGLISLVVLVLGVLIGAAVWQKYGPSPLDSFAQCITDKGGKMYGAYWCSHCAEQKALFGSAFRKIEYVECSSPGSKTFDLCPNIEGTPTWETSDGTQYRNTQTLESLAEIYSCPLVTE